jgi:hypothetical protein
VVFAKVEDLDAQLELEQPRKIRGLLKLTICKKLFLSRRVNHLLGVYMLKIGSYVYHSAGFE